MAADKPRGAPPAAAGKDGPPSFEAAIERLTPGAAADEAPRTEPADLDLKSPENPSEGQLPF